MYTQDEIIEYLRTIFRRELRLVEDAGDRRSPSEGASYQENLDIDAAFRQECGKRIRHYLELLLCYPPCHEKHFARLSEFHESGDYDRSVFIMTKFPEDGDDSEEAEGLRNIVKAVCHAVEGCSFFPRIAEPSPGLLWDTVELHLLGCRLGIAIVEDRYRAELNPNVAMEWGWMRGMGKEVLYLRENGFDHARANWSGLTEFSFTWEKPEEGIVKRVGPWLEKQAAAL